MSILTVTQKRLGLIVTRHVWPSVRFAGGRPRIAYGVFQIPNGNLFSLDITIYVRICGSLVAYDCWFGSVVAERFWVRTQTN